MQARNRKMAFTISFMMMPDRKKTKKEFPTWLRHKEFKGDTIERLAKELKLDPAALKATMDNYNKMAATGEDTEVEETRWMETLEAPSR